MLHTTCYLLSDEDYSHRPLSARALGSRTAAPEGSVEGSCGAGVQFFVCVYISTYVRTRMYVYSEIYLPYTLFL